MKKSELKQLRITASQVYVEARCNYADRSSERSVFMMATKCCRNWESDIAQMKSASSVQIISVSER